jgi:signal transduction histidine kinase
LIQTIREVFETDTSRQAICSLMFGGNEHVLSTNFSGLQDENGKVFAVLGIARDITRRKKMEEQMFYTEKLASIGTLAAGVAHEINNPLAIILGFADLLMEKTPPESQAYEMLKTIEKQGLNAKRVVENLLGFTRFSEHKEETVDINKNLESVLSFVSNTLLLNKISVIKDLSLSLPEVKGDPGEIQQVFFNIINNAVAAMKGGGLLMVSTKEVNEEQNVEIRIQDSGCGISKEYRTKIFDPLFTTKKVGEGTGLGLFVSYGIITKHGGALTFDSIANDECSESGTTFIITLPAADQTDVV